MAYYGPSGTGPLQFLTEAIPIPQIQSGGGSGPLFYLLKVLHSGTATFH